MTTEPSGTQSYTITLDREACDGVFACLVRDERFVEAADGLATIEGGADTDDGAGIDPADDRPAVTDGGTITARFDDDRLDEARQAASACPLDAIEVTTGADASGDPDE